MPPLLRAGIAAAALSLLCACGPAGSTPTQGGSAPPPVAPTASPAQPELPAGEFEVVFGPRAGLSVRVPAPAQWRAEDTERWFTLSHVGTETKLALRTWRAERRVRPEQCQAQARLWRHDLPALPSEHVVDERTLSSPAEHAVHLTVLVQRAAPGEPIVGWALAFGAAIGKCYAAIFETRARGAGAEAAIAGRLALAADAILPSVQEQGIDERVLRPR
ncbi:MAG TPA: hypothetical protein PKD61_13770 [Polyangiaceae bacterium]|nr:hypothetical protein [Polyangiaceae bacterium]